MPDEDALDPRRKRLLFRARRRGMHENDVLIGRWADAHIAGLSDDQLDRLELLLDQIDLDVFDWIMRRKPTPPAFETDVMDMIRRHNKIV